MTTFSDIYSFTHMLLNKSYYHLTNYFSDNLNRDVERMKSNISYTNSFLNLMIESSHIIDNIYLGNAYNAANYNRLLECNIKTIINVSKEIPNFFEYTNEFNYHKIEVTDHNESSLISNFKIILECIDNNKDNGKILIHCYAGCSRSATIVALYLMNKYDMTVDDAIEFIQDKRDIININVKFIEELRKYPY